MATFLHTMVRITDPEKSRAFYEALGFRFSRDMDIVRDGELEATNYFYSIGDAENVLELTYNHDGRTYELGTAYGHIAIGVDDLDATLAELAGPGHRARAARRTRWSRAAHGSASSAIRIESLQSSTDIAGLSMFALSGRSGLTPQPAAARSTTAPSRAFTSAATGASSSLSTIESMRSASIAEMCVAPSSR